MPPMAAELAFAGEVQDLQEMLGNLLDNACKWARSAPPAPLRGFPPLGAACGVSRRGDAPCGPA
jgi:hypothetical protein